MRLLRLLLISWCGLFLGCGSTAPVPVNGTVTWNGQPVADGNIVFKPTDGTIDEQSGSITNGEFTVQVTPGKKRIEIYGMRQAVGQTNDAMRSAPRENYIPERYNTKSTLSEEVRAKGENRFTFNLPNKP